jgi:hypothetical protein
VLAQPTPTPNVTIYQPPPTGPCVPDFRNGLLLNCTGNLGMQWAIRVSVGTRCPINRVLRDPFPRSLVSVPTNFWLMNGVNDIWSPSQAGNWSNRVSPTNLSDFMDGDGNPTVEGVVRNVQLGLRSQRLAKGTNYFGEIVPDVQWGFTGRGGGGYLAAQQGISATYQYETASFGQPNRGRAFDFARNKPTEDYSLPAYPVSIETYCGHQWSMRWQESVKDFTSTGPCEWAPRAPWGIYIPEGYDQGACPTGMMQPGTATYRWVDRNERWTPIDMRELGAPLTYVPVRRAQGGGLFQRPDPYWDDNGGIWVPVIEVQTVLRDQ